MPFYRFWTLNEHNQTITGMIMACSQNHVAENLHHFNQKPLKIRRLHHLSLSTFNDIDRFEICHSVSELLNAGITLGDAFNALSGDQKKLKRRILCFTFAQRIRFGYGMHSFNQKEFFDETAFQTLLRAEQTGNLAVIFSTLSHHYQIRHEYRQELYRIIRYPIFLGITLCILITILSTLVLPNLETLMPTKPRGFAYTSFKWFGGNLDLIVGFILGLIMLAFMSKQLFYRVPVISRMYMGQFWCDLAFCLQHNISLIDALELTKKSLPLFFQKHVHLTRKKLLNGKNLSDAFETLPANSHVRSSLIALAQKTGNVTGMIQHLAKLENIYINNLIKKLLSWTQPLLILIMGLVVLWILQATIVPLYDSLAEFKD